MNADLHMAGDLKNTAKGSLFVIFGEPDIDIIPVQDDGATGTRSKSRSTAWTSRPFERPASGRIAVKVINHLGDEVMTVFRV